MKVQLKGVKLLTKRFTEMLIDMSINAFEGNDLLENANFNSMENSFF